MGTTRREMLTGLAAATAIGAAAGKEAGAQAPRRAMPKGFLWGAAISAHQSEGNDVNSDGWLLENLPETVYAEPSGDACDSYHRYKEDLAIARSLGLNCYRFGIEYRYRRPDLRHRGFGRARLPARQGGAPRRPGPLGLCRLRRRKPARLCGAR